MDNKEKKKEQRKICDFYFFPSDIDCQCDEKVIDIFLPGRGCRWNLKEE